MAASAAETHNTLRELARLGAAFAKAIAELPAVGRELIDVPPDEADGTTGELRDLAASADADANTLTDLTTNRPEEPVCDETSEGGVRLLPKQPHAPTL